jgi:hypothetical protein
VFRATTCAIDGVSVAVKLTLVAPFRAAVVVRPVTVAVMLPAAVALALITKDVLFVIEEMVAPAGIPAPEIAIPAAKPAVLPAVRVTVLSVPAVVLVLTANVGKALPRSADVSSTTA